MGNEKKIVIIAGPNGVGKTTFALEFLPREANCPDFINVDLIAVGLSPFDPDRAAIRAGRLMIEEIKRRVRDGNSFAFETTLSGRHYAGMIPRWRATDHVKLIFLSLPTADMAVARGPHGWHKGDTVCLSLSYGVVLTAGCATSIISIGHWSTVGHCTIIQV